MLIGWVGCGTVLSAAPPADAAQSFTASLSPDDSARAENAPLFASHNLLELTVQLGLTAFKSDRTDPVLHPARLSFQNAEGNVVTVDVKLKPRGNWRLQPRNCNFPNYWLGLPENNVENTMFEGQDRLPVVTPCRDNRRDYEQYIIQEYLAYRLYNVLTESSFRVRLARMTYVDTGGKRDTITKYTFFVEHADQLAARHRMAIFDMHGISQDMVDPNMLTLMLVFQYLIANTDWSVSGLHNMWLLVDQEQVPIAVPFDFDWSGLVNPQYATPPPQLGIRTVRQRLWRGLCMPEELARAELAPVFTLFNERKDAIYALFTDQEGLDEKGVRDTHRFLDEFYATINDPRRVRREFIQTCRGYR